MDKKIKDGIIKPTFSAVHHSQQLFIKLLMQLIKENRGLTEQEWDTYQDLLATSTLGLGVNKEFKIFIEGTIYHYGNIESVARWIASQTTNKIHIPSDYGAAASPSIEIKIFWEKLLELLYFVFPVALDTAVKMSKEIPSSPGFDGVEIK